MNPVYLILPALLLCNALFAQILKKDQAVEVNALRADTGKISWKKALITEVDTARKIYYVKLEDDRKMEIPSTNPEKWIRPDAKRLALLGPDKQIRYERSALLIRAFSCRPSETYIKRNVKARIAEQFKDFPSVFVDFTSFKAQNGYDDPKVKNQQVFPYKIEMLVYLKRTVLFGGKEFYEYQTWEFDREYEYATRPNKQCAFYALPSGDAVMKSQGWYYVGEK